MQCYWIKNSEYDLVKLRDASDSVAVIPLASIESHGPHLPLGSDPLCLDYLMEQVIKEETVAVLPTMHYSSVIEARMLPGAINIPSDLIMDLTETICDEAYRNGFDKIVLIHGHGGNVALHLMICKRALEREKPYSLYSIPVFGRKGTEITDVCDTDTNGHACEMETSMNMTTAPEHVNLKALGAKEFPTQPSPQVLGAHTPVEWVSRYPEMAVGYPQKATKEKGDKIMDIWAREVIDTLRAIKADTVVAREMKRYSEQSQSIREKMNGK